MLSVRVVKRRSYFHELIRDLIKYYMADNKGNMAFFTTHKINTFFLRNGKKIYPGHFNIIYAILRCIARKTNGVVIIDEEKEKENRRQRPVIGIPQALMSMDYDQIIAECVDEVVGM